MEVEVDSDGEVDARDDLDALVVVRDCSVRLMRMMLVEAGQRVAERILARSGSDQALLLREADRVPRPMPCSQLRMMRALRNVKCVK